VLTFYSIVPGEAKLQRLLFFFAFSLFLPFFSFLFSFFSSSFFFQNRGTVSDVRSLVKTKKICIEGYMQRKKGNSWERAWYVLDSESEDLQGFAKRPAIDQEPQTVSILLDDVNQVLRMTQVEANAKVDLKKSQPIKLLNKNREFTFQLCDAASENIATFRCDDKSSLLWWMHGFQRRIFEQTKGMIKRQKEQKAAEEAQEGKRYQTLPRALTISGIKHKDAVKAKWLYVTAHSEQGRRKNMEDETLIKVDLNAELSLDGADFGQLALIGVFDGHAGRECAEYASEFMIENLSTQDAFKQKDFGAALTKAFVQTDEEFREWALENENISGSTAICVLFHNRRIYVANSGDCRAVLCRKGSAVDLSSDHKPTREDERDRIELAGGWIDSQDVLNIPKLYALGLEHTELLDEHHELIGWVTVHKVMGALGMTRSMGDVLIKSTKLAENFESCYEEGFQGELIIAEPEILTDEITAEDDFLVVACDGLWDVFSSQMCVEFISAELDKGTERNEVVNKLIARALELGTLDNVSVTITFFNHKIKV
jgi:protein phosphatase 2C family protein 2/3